MREREKPSREWCLVAVSRAARVVLALPILLSMVACGTGEAQTATTTEGNHGESDASSPVASPDASDLTLFSDIDVRIRVSVYDSVDSAPDKDGNFPPEPPIVASRAVRVEINDGTAEGRVPQLRVFSDGEELTETASAGFPQRLSFQHYNPDNHDPDQEFEISFRYQGASYALTVAPLGVELISPTAEQVLSENEPLTLQWSGIAMTPEPVIIGSRGQNCIVIFTRADDRTFVPERKQSGQGPPCRFELSADWQAESMVSGFPFRSLELVRAARRMRRFSVE